MTRAFPAVLASAATLTAGLVLFLPPVGRAHAAPVARAAPAPVRVAPPSKPATVPRAIVVAPTGRCDRDPLGRCLP